MRDFLSSSDNDYDFLSIDKAHLQPAQQLLFSFSSSILEFFHSCYWFSPGSSWLFVGSLMAASWFCAG